MNHWMPKLLVLVSLVGLLARPVAAAEEKPSAAQTGFQRAYYLETHEHDLAAAAIAYEQVLADTTTPAPLAAEAKTRLARVREDLAAVDFAHLMPADVMGYAELSEPGKHVARILKMMGLIARRASASPRRSPRFRWAKGCSCPPISRSARRWRPSWRRFAARRPASRPSTTAAAPRACW